MSIFKARSSHLNKNKRCILRIFVRGVKPFLLLTTAIYFACLLSSIILPNGRVFIDNKKASNLPATNEFVKIAYVVSLITCQKERRVKGFLDALVILRHSIHRNSVHVNPNSSYSYQMYAIVHKQGGCVVHTPLLERLGYIPLIRDTPVNISDIKNNDWYRDHVEGENCCGSKEFIKLYAYQLTDYPVVVTFDLDVAVLQPMDDLFDAIIYNKEHPRGKNARERLQIQRPFTQKLPDRIDAFITRDVTSAKPWEKVQGVQGGFLVARPNIDHFQKYQKFILEANYSRGRGPTSGWGGMGGGFQGGMAYQGVVAFFYDNIHPGHAVELDVCRWNQVVADVIYRGPENPSMIGQCRQYPVDGIFDANTPENGQCEDCRVVPVSETKTVHYTACKKPWECAIPYPRVPGENMKAHAYRLQELTNITTCGSLFREYFRLRQEVEAMITQVYSVPRFIPSGTFQKDFFLGYCERRGKYKSMQLPDDLTMKTVYGF